MLRESPPNWDKIKQLQAKRVSRPLFVTDFKIDPSLAKEIWTYTCDCCGKKFLNNKARSYYFSSRCASCLKLNSRKALISRRLNEKFF